MKNNKKALHWLSLYIRWVSYGERSSLPPLCSTAKGSFLGGNHPTFVFQCKCFELCCCQGAKSQYGISKKMKNMIHGILKNVPYTPKLLNVYSMQGVCECVLNLQHLTRKNIVWSILANSAAAITRLRRWFWTWTIHLKWKCQFLAVDSLADKTHSIHQREGKKGGI